MPNSGTHISIFISLHRTIDLSIILTMLLRTSQNRFYEPNTAKYKVIKDLVSKMAPAICQKANQFISIAKSDQAIPVRPNKSYYTDLDFSGTLNQIIACHASAMARSILNKVLKAKNAKQPSKYQMEILAKWEKGIYINKITANINLDQRVMTIVDSNTSHDYWIEFKFPHMAKFCLPIRKTRHMRQLESRGYSLKRSTVRLNQDGSITLSYEKTASQQNGISIGIDMGRDKAITRSDGYTGYSLSSLLDKINRKKRGSKNYQQAKAEIKNVIGYAAKRDINWDKTGEISIENLKNMKRNKSWGNKSHHWRIGLLRTRVLGWAEEFGVRVVQVNPAYTSQTCSDCGHLDKENRNRSKFLCLGCGYELDADINAARNIYQRGMYVSLLRKQQNSIESNPDIMRPNKRESS